MRKLVELRTRIFAFILALIMLFLSLPSYALSLSLTDNEVTENKTEEVTEDYSKVSVLHDGAKKSFVNLAEDGKETLAAFVTGIKPSEISWQILIPGGNKWVNINGCNSETLPVSYAVVGSMLDADNNAFIRSSVKSGNDTYVSEPVGISADAPHFLQVTLIALSRNSIS